MYRFLAKVVPKKTRRAIARLLIYSGIKYSADHFIGFVFLFGFGISLVVSLDLGAIFDFPVVPVMVVSFILVQLVVYLTLQLKADAKGRFVESILPDALQLMASNLRAGLTTDRALLLSARPEFGPFQTEITLVGKEITMGTEVDRALLGMHRRIKSEKLKKTVILISSGIRAGGELASLLEQTASNLRKQKFVEERMKSSILMYVMFIYAAIGFGAPLLFGLSSFLAEVMGSTMAKMQSIPSSQASSMGLNIGSASLETGFVVTFCIISLISMSVLGSLVIGLISRGRERDGIRYIIPMIIISLIVFFGIRYVITASFGGMFSI